MFVLLLTAILCCVVFAWSRFRQRHHSPPALPGALPLIGHALQAFGDRKHLWKFVQHFQKYSLSKGGVTEFWLGLHSLYVVTDPEDSLKVVNSCLSKPYLYEFAKDFLDNGLVTTQASKWKIHRKLLNPAFSQQVLNTYIYEMSVQARNLASQLSSKAGKGPFDARKCFIKFALSTVTRSSLGLSTQDQDAIDTDYAERIEKLLASFCDRFQKVWLHLSYIFDWSTMKREQNQIITQLNSIINPIIYKRKSELKANKDIVYDDSPGKFKPILDQLLQMAEEQDVFTDDEIRHHLDTFVAAAYDTTSSSMIFVLVAIGSDPELQERVFKELQEVLLHEDDDLTKEDLQKLVYLEAVIKETIRLYPPVPLIGRKVDTDIKLSNCTLRAGNTCGIGLYGLLRHPMWGPDAEQFRPERWLDPANLPDHPSLHASFGVGKRNCIGKQYSMMLLKAALAHILRRYHVTGNIRNLVCEYDVMLKPVEGHFIGLTLRT